MNITNEKLDKLSKDVTELTVALNKIYELSVGATLNHAREQADAVQRAANVSFLKTIVAEMAVLIARSNSVYKESEGEIAAKVIKAYSLSDKWWLKREKLTMAGWIEEILNISGTHAGDENEH